MHAMIQKSITASAQQTRRPVGFVRCRRAAATALTAAVFTLMSVAGIALTSDHTHLVYQRDTLKAATDAACLAATRHLWTLGQDLSDEKVHAALRPIAERYILANIPESRRKRAAETLVIPPLAVDRQAGRVSVTAAADLGGAIFGSWMYGKVTQTTQVACLSEGEVADGTTPPTPDEQTTPDTPPMTELVLAIDITSSMLDDIDGCRTCGESRMSIVKRAAQKLVGTITADASRTVAVGLVPWHFRVKFDQETRTRWEDLGWAEYPTRRYYPNPYWGSWTNIGRPLNGGNRGGWFPDPHLPTAAGEWHDLPNKPEDEDWQGCVDQRRMSGDNPPGISAVPPTPDEPFTMGFYSPTVGYPQTSPISYPCRQADLLPDRPNECFYNPSGFTEADDKIYFQQPQFNCYHSEIVPLTTDIDEIKRKISALRAGGASTYSTLGAVWGHRLLAPTWRSIWSDASVHPVDVAPNVRKVLVLLTDGDDNHLERDIVRSHRSQACTAAKDAGIEIITVFAGSPSSSLKDELLQCASPASQENPEEGGNSFTGTTSEELEGAFEEIGQRLFLPLRLR